jgi:predicted deacylase
MPSIEVNRALGRRGVKVSGVIDTGVVEQGRAVTIPITVICGKTDGPCLSLQAAQHGPEMHAIGALIRLAAETDPARLAGSLIILPCMNPLAIAARHHFYPPPSVAERTAERPIRDRTKDMNRAWPGRPDGSIVERLAFALSTQMDAVEYVIDYHSWDRDFQEAAMLKSDEPHQLAFGACLGMSRLIVRTDGGTPGMFSAWMLRTGRSVVTVEHPGQMYIRPALAQAVRRTALNAMRWLGMVEGECAFTEEVLVGEPGRDEQELTIPHAGVYEPQIDCGATVASGQVLGRLIDPFTGDVTELQAPIAGIATRSSANHAYVKEGDTVASVAPRITLQERYPEGDRFLRNGPRANNAPAGAVSSGR